MNDIFEFRNGLVENYKKFSTSFASPRSEDMITHEPRVLWAGSDEDALDSLALISLLHKKLDRCVRTH
jgi:hypothetical protein